MSSTDDNGEVGLSWATAILAFIEAEASAAQLQAKVDRGTVADPWLDPLFYLKIYPAGVLACSSDVMTASAFDVYTGQLSYRASLGDTIENHHLSATLSRGMFTDNRSLRIADIMDGLSNTVQYMEMASGMGRGRYDPTASMLLQVNGVNYASDRPNDCRAAWSSANATFEPGAELTGTRWADGRPYYASAVTALPPNGPKCASGGGDLQWGVYTAGSRHPGGCHVAMGDGSVRFVTESIDSGYGEARGSSNLIGPSPYGVWGSMGTRDGKEVIGE